MDKVTEEKIKQKYELSPEEIEQVKQTIISVLSAKTNPTQAKPLAIVVGGQSGAGKTALIDYTLQLHPGGFVTIDNDFFRVFHPRAKEIKANDPEWFTAATDQIGLEITPDILDHFIEQRYNLILHQTLRGNRVADDAITKMRNAGYTVGVRAMAVSYFESKMSQIERCLGQLESVGYCRYVRKDDHNAAINGLPRTVQYIESSRAYDFLEVFKRGQNIETPELIYSKLNPDTKEETLRVLSSLRACERATLEDCHFGYEDAKAAILKSRLEQSLSGIENIEKRIEAAEMSPYNTSEMQTHINELKDELLNFKIEHGTNGTYKSE